MGCSCTTLAWRMLAWGAVLNLLNRLLQLIGRHLDQASTHYLLSISAHGRQGIKHVMLVGWIAVEPNRRLASLLLNRDYFHRFFKVRQRLPLLARLMLCNFKLLGTLAVLGVVWIARGCYLHLLLFFILRIESKVELLRASIRFFQTIALYCKGADSMALIIFLNSLLWRGIHKRWLLDLLLITDLSLGEGHLTATGQWL